MTCSSNFSDGTVTEHSLHVFELQGMKDPLFLHKITFITDYANDWLQSLNFEVVVKGENVITGCTANSCMLLTFALKDKRLELFEKEFSLDENPEGKPRLTLVQFSCLAPRGNSVWACTTENNVNRITFK